MGCLGSVVGIFHLSLRLLGASCRLSCGLGACWIQLGSILETSSKHFVGVMGHRQKVFSGLGGDMTVIVHF